MESYFLGCFCFPHWKTQGSPPWVFEGLSSSPFLGQVVFHSKACSARLAYCLAKDLWLVANSAIGMCAHTFVWPCLFFFWNKCLRVQLLGHNMISCAVLYIRHQILFQVAVLFWVPTSNIWVMKGKSALLVCILCCQYLCVCVCVTYSDICVPVSVWVLICIYLMTNDAELLFLCLLVTRIFSSRNCLFIPPRRSQPFYVCFI